MGWDRHKLLWDGTDKYVPWTTLANVEGFIASFKRIWEHTKHKCRGGCALHGAAVKPSFNHFLTFCLTISFRFLVHTGTVNISHILFMQIVVNLNTGPCFMSTLRIVLS